MKKILFILLVFVSAISYSQTSSGLDASRATSGLTVGEKYYATDSQIWYEAISTTQWVSMGGTQLSYDDIYGLKERLSNGDASTTNEVQNLSYDAANHEIDITLSGTSAVIPLADDNGATEGLASFDNTNFDVDASGNVTIASNGVSNAATATTLQTARNINGVSFNGSADVNVDNNLNALLAGGSPFLATTFELPLIQSNTSTALVDNTVRFVAVYLPKAATLTGIRVYVRTLGNYTGDNNNRVGLYSYSGGTLTLVASSANSSSLWKSAANAFQTIAFSSTYAASAGLYFVGLLYNQSAQTTAPALAGGAAFNNVAMVTYQGTNSIKFFGTLTSSNDLPSSQAMSGVVGVTASYWVALY